MTTRTIKDGPFCWENKGARRIIRERLAAEVDAPDVRATALGVYSALAEAASDAGRDSFTVSLARLGELAAMNEKTVRRRLHDLSGIGLVTVETAALRAPSRFTLLSARSGTRPERSVAESERSDFVGNPHQVRGIEEKEKKNTEEPLPGFAGKEVAETKSAENSRKPDPLFDALALHAEASATESLTKSAKRTVAVALAEIRAASPNLTAAEIQRRAENYRQHFTGAACTAPALAKHWARCGDRPSNRLTQPLRRAVC